jgi:hypothetical protein
MRRGRKVCTRLAFHQEFLLLRLVVTTSSGKVNRRATLLICGPKWMPRHSAIRGNVTNPDEMVAAAVGAAF